MLYLIGLGLDDEEITLKGLEALKEVEKVYAEFYTNTETVDIKSLEEKIGKDIEVLNREEVEQKDRILESAKEKDTAFLVSGDPLTATTHYGIKHRAEQEEIPVKVVHAPSILTSVAETGLNVYKFGRAVTVPKNASPDSITEHIKKNDSVGLHTLVLLDIDYKASEAAAKLTDLDPELSERKVVVLTRANSDTQEITVTTLEEATSQNFGDTPHCITIIGETSHMEEEFLNE